MKPLIFDFTTQRKEARTSVPYFYDESLSLNILLENGIKMPFIDVDTSNVMSATQTKVSGERDDHQLNPVESSGQSFASGNFHGQHDLLLILKTKTFTVSEKDDK